MPKTLTRRNGVVLMLAVWSALNAGGAPERVPAPSVRPALLDAAFHAYIEDQGRWAYTETRGGKHHDGNPVAETIVLVDPSRRYVEQYVPVKFQGQEPPEKIRRAWAEYGETLARRRQERIDAGKTAEVGDAEFRLKVNGRDVVPDLGHAVVIADGEASTTYAIPLRLPDGEPFDETELTARVGKASGQFEHVTIRQLRPKRVIFAKFSDGLSEMDFTQPDPRHASVPTAMHTWITVKPLFGGARTTESTIVRTNLRRVTPFDERAGVKLGPLNVLEF